MATAVNLCLYTGAGAPRINVSSRAHQSLHLCPGAHSGSHLSSRPAAKFALAVVSLHLGQASLLPLSPPKSISSFLLRPFPLPQEQWDKNKWVENLSYQLHPKSRLKMAMEDVKEPKAQPLLLLPLFPPTSSAKSPTVRGPHSSWARRSLPCLHETLQASEYLELHGNYQISELLEYNYICFKNHLRWRSDFIAFGQRPE